MKKYLSLGIMLVFISIILSCLSPSYFADTDRVFDEAELLTEREEISLTSYIKELEEKSGTKFYFVSVFEAYPNDEYTAGDFISDYSVKDEDFILLTVVERKYEINYYLDTVGDTESRISYKEVNYILDGSDVYDNIKYGSVYDGAYAFFTLSEKAYSGRLGASYLKISVISLVIASVISIIACSCVFASYKKKQRQVKYPLDRYAKLDLKVSNDVFTGSFVTSRRIQSSSGSGSGSGGGSRRGGR